MLNSDINRRQFDRISFNDKFVVETENFRGVASAHSQNLSQKGALIISNQSVAKGCVISIEIPSHRLQLLGEVRWVEPMETGDEFAMGIAFYEVVPGNKRKISSLLEEAQQHADSTSFEGKFSFVLEQNIASFLDKHIEDLTVDETTSVPVTYRRLNILTEKSFSFYTPTRSNPGEMTSTSYRIDQMEKTVPAVSTRTIVLGLILIGLIGAYVAISNAHWF
jgi:hypothetical protein